MKTLVVKDLSMTEKMEPNAMARMRGGLSVCEPHAPLPLPLPLPLPIELPEFPFFPVGHPVAKPAPIEI
jgi:hypothetical protein